MTLENLKNWIKAHTDVGDGIQLGGIDGNRGRFIGVYPSKNSTPQRICLGGAAATLADELQAVLLVHWTKSLVQAEAKAKEIAALFYGLEETSMDGAWVYTAEASRPIWAGKDSSGVCEFVINVKLTYKKE